MSKENWIFVKEPPPHDKREWVKEVAHIKKVSTGEIVRYEATGLWVEDDCCPLIYIWESGNFSCDCNRELFFSDAKGIERPDDVSCGEGGYLVNLENPKTGEIFYREFEQEKSNEAV